MSNEGVALDLCFTSDTEHVRYFAMSLKYLNFYEQRFLLSNGFVQFVLGLHPSQGSTNQLLQWCAIAIYLIPMIAHQVNVSFLNLCVIIIIIIITVISFTLILNKYLLG